MPRKTGASGRSHARLNQAAAAQNNVPAARTPPQQSLPESSRQSSPSVAGGGRGRLTALRLQKQLDAEQAEKWKKEIAEHYDPLPKLCEEALNMAQKARHDFTKSKEMQEKLTQTPQNQELMEKLAMALFDRSIALFGKAQSYLDEHTVDGINIFKRLNSTLENFDSLENKDSLCTIDPELKKTIDKVKKNVADCAVQNMLISHSFNKAMQQRSTLEIARLNGLSDEYQGLMKKNWQGNYSVSLRSDVEKLIADFDGCSERMMTIHANGEKVIKTCDELLTDPYLQEQQRNEVSQYQKNTQFSNTWFRLKITQNTYAKIEMLMRFSLHDCKTQQASDNLEKWVVATLSLLQTEYRGALSLAFALMDDELDTQKEMSALSHDELLLKLEAATTLPAQFEKFARNCEKRAAEYENLQVPVEKEKLVSALKEMVAKSIDCVADCDHILQRWTDRVREAEKKNSTAAASSSQRASKQSPGAKFKPAQKKALHRTKEGVVVGRINPKKKDRLEGLDVDGKVISTYFKDEDNENWVRDYDDELGSSLSSQSSAPTADTKEIAAREKAEILLQKTRNIVEASIRFSQKVRTDTEASRNYDDKESLLQRAFSDKVRAIARVNEAKIELEELQAVHPLDENWSALLQDHLNFLRKDKNELDRELQQAKQDMYIHSRKRRDPAEANFNYLWEQGEVASIRKEFDRRKNRDKPGDFLERYIIALKPGPQGEQYKPWVVHAHYNTSRTDASPVRVHMKRYDEKNWGVELSPYHSRPLSEETFKRVRQEALPFH